MRSWQSLQRKLPLLFTVLLCLVVGALGWSAYRQLEAVLVQTAGNRVAGAAHRLAGMLDQSADQIRSDARRVAADPVVAHMAIVPGGWSRRAAQGALARERQRITRAVSVALLDRDFEPVAVAGTVAAVQAPARAVAAGLASQGVWIGPLRRGAGGVIYDVIAPVRDRAGTTAGYVVISRELAQDGTGERIAGLIGTDASVLFGNRQGGLWTDLAHPVDAAPPARARPGVPTRHVRGGAIPVLGATVPVRSTPWMVWVELPRRAAIEPARHFVLQFAEVAFVFVALGALVVWLVSHRVTTPLVEVSRAAEDVARGNYARRVSISRRDEIGSLADSFNSMAAQVDAASRDMQAHAVELEAINAELLQSETQYRQLVELSPDAILVHRDGRVLFANPAAGALVGVAAPAALIGSDLDALVLRADGAGVSDQRAPAGAGAPLVQARVRRADGTVRAVETTSSAFLFGGEPATLTIVRDVSERARMEERFRQVQKMEAVGQLAGGVAHDFNNLLTVITSYSGLLLGELPPGHGARADVQEIADAAARAAALTRQLLAFSRRQVLQPQPLDLNAIVRDVEKMLRRVVPADLKLVTSLDPTAGTVHADAGQLEQVLMNLALNAQDAMPDGGTLVLETANVELDDASAALQGGIAPGPYVRLTVSDTGCGMTPEQQARIFEPFYTTKEPGKGTGLGLSTVYGIVQQSGGVVSVYSEPGEGTVFRVLLPRIDAPAGAPSRPGAAIVTAGTETILVVEDEAAVRAAARRILERAGYSVLEAASGLEALAMHAEHGAAIDTVLTDLVMPDMGGRELAERIRARDPAARVVFMSGYTEDVVLRRSIVEPGALFVQKPFTPRSLTAKLRESLDAGGVIVT